MIFTAPTDGIGPLSLTLRINHGGFINGNIPCSKGLVRGRWHLIELELQLSSSHNAADGSVKIWLDNELVASKTGWPIPGAPPMTAVRYAPIFESAVNSPVLQYLNYDHVVISGK